MSVCFILRCLCFYFEIRVSWASRLGMSFLHCTKFWKVSVFPDVCVYIDLHQILSRKIFNVLTSNE